MKRNAGILIVIGVYLLAFGGSMFLYFEQLPLLVNLLIMDTAATLVIFIAGIIARSASFYDPYWSLQTLAYYLFVMVKFGNYNLGTFLILGVLVFYSGRLTGNFFLGFTGFDYEDPRYRDMRARFKNPVVFQIISYLGIHMMPTLLVFFASTPMFLYACDGKFTGWEIISVVIMVGAVLLALVADAQMKSWQKRRTSREEVFSEGVWNYSRHPNYLGEISFWFGPLVLLYAHPNHWYCGFGAILILLLFLFISIPMIEKRFSSYKPGYAEYKRRTHTLLLLPHKKTKGDVD